MATKQIEKQDGIVLHALRYGEASLVVRVFTRQHGLRSFMVRQSGQRRKSSGGVLFQPLTHLEFLTSRGKGNSGLDAMREARLLTSPLLAAPGVLRSSVALFVADVLNQTIRHQEADLPLYQFVEDFIAKVMVAGEELLTDMPLIFMMQLADLLGFAPLMNYSPDKRLFDLMEGRFTSHAIHGYYIPAEWAEGFQLLTERCRGKISELSLPSGTRSTLLAFMIEYFQLQVSGIGEIKSHRVLREVLSV